MRKKFEIEKAPQVLVIHLKRFGDSSGFSRSKITADIDFPMNFQFETNSYTLRAVCNHSGGGKLIYFIVKILKKSVRDWLHKFFEDIVISGKSSNKSSKTEN